MQLRSIMGALLALTILWSGCQDDDGMLVISSLEDLVPKGVDYELDPHGISPLTAVASFESEVPCAVTVEVKGAQPVVHSFSEFDDEQEIPILGLYPDAANEVVLTFETEDGQVVSDTHVFTTEALPDDMPTVEVEIVDDQRMEPGMHLSGLSLANNGLFKSQPIIFDNNGDIRWYLDLSDLGRLAFPIKRLKNGNIGFVVFTTLYEYTMTGEQVNTWDMPGYHFHHEFLEMPNGNFIIAVDKDDATIFNGNEITSSPEDHIIEVDRNSGNMVREWDFRQFLDVTRYDLVDGSGGDWFHMNAIYYDEEDDALIVSGRNQGVVKVSMDNELIWILAPHQGWGQAGPMGEGPETVPFLLEAVDGTGTPYPQPVQQGTEAAADFDWSWGQHAPLILPNGNYFVFDNGLNRQFTAAGPYSRGVEYRVDEANMTVEQVWQYGKERGPEFFSPIISDVDYLPTTQNRLIVPGTINFDNEHYARITEVTYPLGEVVFEAKITFQDVNGNGTNTWGEIDLVYRAERLSLYP